MPSIGAFNASKNTRRTPKHVVFILATTEKQKIIHNYLDVKPMILRESA